MAESVGNYTVIEYMPITFIKLCFAHWRGEKEVFHRGKVSVSAARYVFTPAGNL